MQSYDFNRVIDSRGTLPAGLCLAGAGCVALALVLLSPRLAATALVRLADPFGNHHWPKRTQLEIAEYRSRIGRNEPFDVKATVRGVIPDEAAVTFQFKGMPPEKHTCKVKKGDDPGAGALAMRLDPNRVQRDFTFQVQANDARTDQYHVEVLPPPSLTLLDGRDSPQLRMQFPRYTELPDRDLPAGVGNVETVAGTLLTLRGAADTPLRRAWIAYQPDPKYAEVVAFLGVLGGQHPAETLTLACGGHAVWGQVDAVLEADPRVFTARFLPWVSGMYVLHFEESQAGLRGSRQFELRVLADPAPVVTLDRPAPTRDSLDLLPGADLTLEAIADDPSPGSSGLPVHAVYSAYLEYRCQKADAPRPSPLPLSPAAGERGWGEGRLALYDAHSAGTAVAVASAVALGASTPTPPPVATRLQSCSTLLQPPRLRLQRVEIGRKLALSQFTHLGADAGGLKEGDVLTLQVCADDFDDVTVDKQPGRSHEVEIRIVSRDALDVILSRDQTRLQQELVRLRELERDALKKVMDAQKRWNEKDERLRDDITQFVEEAEQLQKQIREKVGTRKEGLRAEVERILQAMRDNHLPHSTAQERIEDVAAELSRLAREELEQIEPRLTDARKQAEAAPKSGRTLPRTRDPWARPKNIRSR